MDAIYAQILPHLPPTLQQLLLDPPSLSNPQSFIPLVKSLLPYTQYFIVLVAFYIVWTTLRGIAGYFTRFVRFGMKIGPIIGLISWLMANSGQGGLNEVLNAVKEYAGMGAPNNNNNGARAPGIDKLFGTNPKGKPNTRARAKANSGWGSKNTREAGGDDFLSSMINNAANGLGQDDLGNVVKNYVRDSVAKAAGLDWLFGSGSGNVGNNEKEKKGSGWGKSR